MVSDPESRSHLRNKAEVALASNSGHGTSVVMDSDILHELHVHQIELEMQNEALRQSQAALEESRDRYIDLYEFAPVGYLTLTREGTIAEANLTAAKLMGEDRARLLKRRFANYVLPLEQDRWHQLFIHAFKSTEKQTCEIDLRRSDGTMFSACLDSVCLPDTGAVPALRVAISDITERRRAAETQRITNTRLEQLTAEQAAHLRSLARELTYAEQRERDRLYELLHDEMQPLLVAARLLLSSLSMHASLAHSIRVATEACAHIGKTIQIARNLSIQLSPSLIREVGLNAALESLCRWTRENYGLDVKLYSTLETEPSDIAIRLVCFNAIRELLMNVLKHAGKVPVAITLTQEADNVLRIVVADTGCGFDPEAATGGSGLNAIARRMSMLGGSLHIECQSGQGTIATLTVPLRPAMTDGRDLRQIDRRRRETDRDAQNIDCR